MTEQEIMDTVKREHEAIIRKKRIMARLSYIGRIRSASDYSLGGRSASVSDPTAEEAMHREELESELRAADQEIESSRRLLRNVFRRIKDPLLRTICRCRLVKRMKWMAIADLVNMDVPAVKMRYYRFWKSRPAGA